MRLVLLLTIFFQVLFHDCYCQISEQEYLKLRERKHYKDSIATLIALAKFETGYTSAIRIALGSCYNKVEDYRNSIKQYKRVKISGIGSREAILINNGIGNSYYHLAKYSKAIKRFEATLEADSNNVEAGILRALCSYKTHRRDLDTVFLSEVTQLDIAYYSQLYSENLFYTIAELQLSMKKYTEAKANYTLAIEHDSLANWSELENYFVQRSKCYYWLKLYDSSDFDLTHVIEMNHSNKYAYCLRAYTRFERKDFQGVINDVEACLGYFNTGTDYYIRGQAFEELNEYAKALNDYAIVVKRKFNDHVYVHIADCYIKQGQFDNAMMNIKILIKKHPDYSEGYFARGRLYFESNDMVNACADLRRADELGNLNAKMFINAKNICR